VERLPGSALARARLRAVLETLAGTCRVQDACARLGVSEQRFDQLRARVLQASLDSLEPRPAGRRPRPGPTADVAALQARVTALEVELHAARVRVEIALALPAVEVAPPGPAKKARRRRPPARPRRQEEP
jgi:hypothetical protein